MKRLNSILLGTTAAILMLGGTPASGQKAPDASGGAQAPGGAQMQGQGSADMNKGGAGAEAGGKTQGRAQTGQGDMKAQGNADTKSRTSTQGKAESDTSTSGKADSNTGSGGRALTDSKEGKDNSNKAQSDSGQKTGAREGDMQGRAEKDQADTKSDTKGRAESKQGDSEGGSTGRALGGSEQGGGDRAGAGSSDRGDAAVQFTEEHQTKVKTYFQQNKVSVEPVRDIDVSISVGTTVPSTIAFHPLPDTVFVGLPHDHDYVYFVYESDIIIVTADTHVIVYVVSNVV